MIASKRPSTSSLRRFITTRPYVTIAELRRRFGLDEPDMCCIQRDGQTAFVGLPEREGLKLQELWLRDEIGLEMSVEVRAPVVIGVYPMRIARFMQEQPSNGHAAASSRMDSNGHDLAGRGVERRDAHSNLGDSDLSQSAAPRTTSASGSTRAAPAHPQ